jgi:putative FmdB family regulatory protein
MPFYEYECSACKFYVEALQKISDEPLRQCPSCKKRRLKRLVSAPVFRLKGGGWYETDFKSDNEQKRNIAGREEATESKAEEPKKETPAADAKAGDAKPAAKADAKPEAKKTIVSKSAARSSKPAKSSRPSAKKAPAKKKRGRR